MKLTPEQLKQIIKEEIEAVLSEDDDVKKDACYDKVKAVYSKKGNWPSAYASGALVQCREKGAANWGEGGKKDESLREAEITDKEKEELEDVKFRAVEMQKHIRIDDLSQFEKDVDKKFKETMEINQMIATQMRDGGIVSINKMIEPLRAER